MAVRLRSVLITDDVDPKCVRILQDNGVEVSLNTKLAKDRLALIAEIPKYDGLIVRSATTVTADVINASNLSIIGRAGTGTDNIDSDAATRKGVIVMNTPGGNTISAAELTCTMICGLSRSISQADRSMKEGRWDRKLFMGSELQGKTLAVIGLGRIGREVASRMRSFGMTTIGYDPLVSAEESLKFDVKSYPLEELWPLADYITVHVPLIPQTKNLINEAVFNVCKRGVKVINCARGGIVDETALLQALNSGQCGGAGLDVYCEEPPKDWSLAQHPKVIATPHLGASTDEAQSRVAEEIAQQFIDARDGKSLFGAINGQALMNALSPASQPWVLLAEALGAFLSAAAPDKSAPAVVKTCGGEEMKKALSYISTAVCVGALKGSTSNGLNLVNGQLMAKESGMQVSTDYCACGHAQLVVSSGLVKIIGEVQGSQPVLTSLNGFTFSKVAIRAGSSYIFFVAPDVSKVLPSVIETLVVKSAAVQSFASSQAKDGEQGVLLELSGAPVDLDGLGVSSAVLVKL